MNTKTLLIHALAAACLLALSMQRASASDAPHADVLSASQTVRFGDLDLATPAGKKALLARLRAASWQVCSGVAPRLPGLYLENAKCRNNAVNSAVNEVFGAGGKAAQLARLAATQLVMTTAGSTPSR